MGGSADEFPLLSALGLYAADIRGDGNCLFNALSDQLYGHQTEHRTIRARVITYMRDNADYYKQFIDVLPGGGVRRNPKRKNAGAYSTPTTYTPATPEEIDRVFESHLESMAKGGTYGDNMEIVAFSSAYGVDVKIYQRDFAYVVSAAGGDGQRDVAHIAYHTWEHYSSIRNLDGPHTGPPKVCEKALSPEEERRQKEKLEKTPYVLPWMIDVVSSSLPFLADKPTIKRALEESKGNIDSAVSKLLDAEDRGSVSSAQESSSVEREPDSDDDVINGPNKKQDRRLSRATKTMKKGQERRRQIASELASYDGSRESLVSEASRKSRSPGTSHLKEEIADTEDEDSRSDFVKEEGKSEPAVLLSAPSSPRKPVRLKLNPPKPPDPSSTGGGKTQQKQPGPQRKHGPTAREKKDIKKQAQKAARKERALATTSPNGTTEAKKSGLAILTKAKGNSFIESGIKTLYI
ncbi:hypothetical protein W97_00022 [Coniosporium apollinis CBS 100218]|uniref:OTU domain-containing protein n=1 Tax=Coniosporium apollinis (strain CBS 100218) TaxID=1168221 RepID=R7YG02_CONA1|nr:uncharacterized protein W97_00022 [Coniosporium apollinis CBS 100218]EON60813.1 hypothetical protein W97_00022 [Coniosporium apollinis CBS 100218]